MKTIVFFLSLSLFACGAKQQSKANTDSQPLVDLEKEIRIPKADLRQFPERAEIRAPEKFSAKFVTTFGDFVISFERVSAPKGIDRFYSLVKAGYYENILIFRAIDKFMFQFGIHGEPEINLIWKGRKIDDDPLRNLSNMRGTISFASAGPNTRSNQLFINLIDNDRLDVGFTPLGKIVEGLELIDRVNTEYGENSPGLQTEFEEHGNLHVEKKYPNIDRINKIIIIDDEKTVVR